MINVNIIDDTYQHCVSSDMNTGFSITFVVISHGIYKFFHHNKYQTSPNGKHPVHSNWITCFKNNKTMQGKKRPRNYFKSWRAIKRYDNEEYLILDLLDTIFKKDIFGIIIKIWIVCGLSNTTESMFTSSFWWIYYVYVTKCS